MNTLYITEVTVTDFVTQKKRRFRAVPAANPKGPCRECGLAKHKACFVECEDLVEDGMCFEEIKTEE